MAIDPKDLQYRVQELEKELADRERDLAHYRGELSKANKKLESLIGELSRDLKTATQIQRLLVPTEFPNIPGFEFSTKFIPSSVSGGDYLDIFEQKEKLKFGVLVSSASGYGLSALFLSALLKYSGQPETKRGVAGMVDQIIRELLGEMKDTDKSELFYSVVDRKNFELEYVLFGQVSVFHHVYSQDEWLPLDRCGDSVTKGPREKSQAQRIALNSRDRLVICSRGITESKNLEGEEYGNERLIASILAGPKSGVHELRNHVFYEVQKFSEGQQPNRDQTVVVLEVKDRVIKLAKRP